MGIEEVYKENKIDAKRIAAEAKKLYSSTPSKEIKKIAAAIADLTIKVELIADKHIKESKILELKEKKKENELELIKKQLELSRRR